MWDAGQRRHEFSTEHARLSRIGMIRSGSVSASSPSCWGACPTLRNAARDGRLTVTYDTRTTFRRLPDRAPLAETRIFRQSYYGRSVRAEARRLPRASSAIPLDYDVRIRAVRSRLSLSQVHFAQLVGTAGKAVVYQWESRKRCPSLVFWKRIEHVCRTNGL